MIELFAAMLLSNAAATPAELSAVSAMTAPDPKKMSQAEIKAHNAKLDAKHPYFIRCVRSAAIGSLVARNFSCRTNEQWAAMDKNGNQEARAIMDEMASKSWNTSG